MAPARGDTLRPLEVVSRGPRNTGKQYDALHLSPKTPIRVSRSTAGGSVESDSTFEDSRVCRVCSGGFLPRSSLTF